MALGPAQIMGSAQPETANKLLMKLQDKLYEQLTALARLLVLCHTLKVLERQQDDMDMLKGRAGSTSFSRSKDAALRL